MCNCNQKRTAFNAKNLQGNANQDAHQGMNQMKLVQQGPMEINGDITGRKYIFKKKDDINWVDKRDVINMREIKGLMMI